MTKKGRKTGMLWPTIVMGILAVALLFAGYRKGGGLHVEGLKDASVMTAEILPLLFFAFVVAVMVQILLPKELLAKWVGAESGMRAGRPLCEPSSGGGPFPGRRKHRHHGCLSDRMVAVGYQQAPHGSRRSRLETHDDPFREHLLLSAHRRADRPGRLQECAMRSTADR